MRPMQGPGPSNNPAPEPSSGAEPCPTESFPQQVGTGLTTTIENTVPVRLPERDAPDAVITPESGAYSVLAHPALMVTRQLEMLNVFIGYEQANKYAIKDANGQDVGFIAEEEVTLSSTLMRQLLRTRRPFKAVVLDRQGNVVLKLSRPTKWFLNSTMFVHDPDDRLIGEVKQVWHLWRRKYDLFLKRRQFGMIDGGFWAWDFNIIDEEGGLIGVINRNFVGFAREIFTDTGTYAIHMEQSHRPLSLDERAVMLGCAVNIDIDYFSRHSHSGGGFMPIPMFGMGSAAPAEAGAGGTPSVVGPGETGVTGGGAGGG
ncbi:hypothetical protein HK104_011226, partial [Borealophlyctis nickersoniae]